MACLSTGWVRSLYTVHVLNSCEKKSLCRAGFRIRGSWVRSVNVTSVLLIDFFYLAMLDSSNFFMTGSISFLPPYTQEEKKYLDVTGIATWWAITTSQHSIHYTMTYRVTWVVSWLAEITEDQSILGSIPATSKLLQESQLFLNQACVYLLLTHPLPLLPTKVIQTWSEMVNFMAVTTVVRLRAEGEARADLSSGRSRWGSIKQSLPRHSATTFRVPG